MDLNNFDYVAFCDESSKTAKNGIPYFVFCMILMTPARYERVKLNIARAGLDDMLREGEFKGNALGYRGKKVLNSAFMEKDTTSLSCMVDFGQMGIEPILYLAYAFGAEYSTQYDGSNTADFRKYLVAKIANSLPPDLLKSIHKGIHSFKPRQKLEAFLALASAWEPFGPDTTLGSLSRSIKQNFEEGSEDNLIKFGDGKGGFYGGWGC